MTAAILVTPAFLTIAAALAMALWVSPRFPHLRRSTRIALVAFWLTLAVENAQHVWLYERDLSVRANRNGEAAVLSIQALALAWILYTVHIDFIVKHATLRLERRRGAERPRPGGKRKTDPPSSSTKTR